MSTTDAAGLLSTDSSSHESERTILSASNPRHVAPATHWRPRGNRPHRPADRSPGPLWSLWRSSARNRTPGYPARADAGGNRLRCGVLRPNNLHAGGESGTITRHLHHRATRVCGRLDLWRDSGVHGAEISFVSGVIEILS